MARQPIGALWPEDKVAAYASERIAWEHAKELNATTTNTHESFSVRRSRVDARFWEVHRITRASA
jgi:hypothetical protein